MNLAQVTQTHIELSDRIGDEPQTLDALSFVHALYSLEVAADGRDFLGNGRILRSFDQTARTSNNRVVRDMAKRELQKWNFFPFSWDRERPN